MNSCSSGFEVLFTSQTADGKLVTCKLCEKPKSLSNKRFIEHLNKVHIDHQLQHYSHNMSFCKLHGHARGHSHCFHCNKIYIHKNRLITHIEETFNKKEASVQSKRTGNVVCEECGLELLRKNLKSHITRKHPRESSVKSLENTTLFDGICINKTEGIYFVNEHRRGVHYPIIFKKKIINRKDQKISCEAKSCNNMRMISNMSGIPTYECLHLQSVKHIERQAPVITLLNKTLDDLVHSKRISKCSANNAKCYRDASLVEVVHLVFAWDPPPYCSQRFIFLCGQILLTIAPQQVE